MSLTTESVLTSRLPGPLSIQVEVRCCKHIIVLGEELTGTSLEGRTVYACGPHRPRAYKHVDALPLLLAGLPGLPLPHFGGASLSLFSCYRDFIYPSLINPNSMARILAPLATNRGQPARCRPTTSHTRIASEALHFSSHVTPPPSASLGQLCQVINDPNTIAESGRFTSSPRACDTTTPALVMVPTGIGSSVTSPIAQSNHDHSSSNALPSNKHMAILIGIASVLCVLLLALTFIFYHRGHGIRSHCHVNPNLKKRHLSISPVPPTGSREQGDMIITPFPLRDSGIIIEPGDPVDARAVEICELEWRVSHRFGQSEDGVCDSVV
ncbi:hypothetical protein BDN67DRAFT_974552 [Paxillus ammoniavirescens]|nr:hypothetical protein BDN67DRAFT_974552 [Paxillus ammoniavirescens]